MEVLLSLKVVKPVPEVSAREMDSVAERHARQGYRYAFDVLTEAQRYWDYMDKFRRESDRCRRYCYGNQWGDYIVTPEGERMTEEEYILKQGKVPLTNNLIRRLVKNVLGVYTSQNKEPSAIARDRAEQVYGEVLSTLLQANSQSNSMSQVYSRTFEDFLISGFVVHRIYYGRCQDEEHYKGDKVDCWTDYVSANCFFIDNNTRDFRGWDVSCLGEVHDLSFESVCERFAHSPEDYATLRDVFHQCSSRVGLQAGYEYFGYPQPEHWDFLFPANGNRCRVLEVWRRESKPRYHCHDYNSGEIFKIDIEDYDKLVGEVNRRRLELGSQMGMAADEVPLIAAEWYIDNYWYYYFLAPNGLVLEEGETPYKHGSHPYIFRAYPFINGEIHSFVSDVIDAQRYVNRLVTIQDSITRASAKGALIVDKASLGDMSLQELGELWARPDSILPLELKNGAVPPQQMVGQAHSSGISEMLNLQLKFLEDISGVNGALQGKPGYAGTSGSLYAQQTQNATMSLLDLLETFSSFIKDASYKAVKVIAQFYTPERIESICGDSVNMSNIDLRRIRDIEFEISIVESMASPAYRAVANEFLMEIWRNGQITLRQLLEQGTFPFADSLLQSIEVQEQQAMEQQALAQQQELQQASSRPQVGSRPLPEGVSGQQESESPVTSLPSLPDQTNVVQRAIS